MHGITQNMRKESLGSFLTFRLSQISRELAGFPGKPASNPETPFFLCPKQHKFSVKEMKQSFDK